MMLLVSLHAEQYLVALTCYVPGGGGGERQCAVEWPSPHLPHRRFLYLLYRATLRLRTLPFSPVLSFHAPRAPKENCPTKPEVRQREFHSLGTHKDSGGARVPIQCVVRFKSTLLLCSFFGHSAR